MSDGSKKGVQLEPYQVVIRPLVTEKGTHLSESFNAYTFVVDKSATKNRYQKSRV